MGTAEFTTSDIGDAPILPELIDQIPPDQEISSVTVDGAFGTRHRSCEMNLSVARGTSAISCFVQQGPLQAKTERSKS